MKNGRAREFLFDPARFKNDPAVMRMSHAALGLYVILFCEGWDMPDPGVLPDDPLILATLARTDPQTWDELGGEVAAAFDTTSLPGFWVQKGTVETYESQKLWYENAVESGRKGGLSRAARVASRVASSNPQGKGGKGKGGEGKVLVGKRSEKDSDSVPSTGSDSADENPPLASSGNGPVAIAPGTSKARPDNMSDEDWFAQYGRKP